MPAAWFVDGVSLFLNAWTAFTGFKGLMGTVSILGAVCHRTGSSTAAGI